MDENDPMLDDGVIEVQVIPQDDNWGETATTITETATSIVTDLEDLDNFGEEKPKTRYTFPSSKQACGILFSLIIGLVSVLSPIAFIVLPIVQGKNNDITCKFTSCEGMYISLGVKEIVLIVGLWALYIRPARAFMPRLDVFKVGMMVLTYLVIICFWLFYALRILDSKQRNQKDVGTYALSFVDAMLFLHYLSLLLIWIRHQTTVYTISVIRNADGARKYYNVGQNSIQKTAVYALEKYYLDFTEYNPYMPRPSASKAQSLKKFTGLKIYDIDGNDGGASNNLAQQASKAVIAAAAGRRRQGRNDRFYEEQEIERRIRKRRARLVVATEEAFGHIARLNAYEMAKKAAGAMDPEEAAQAIFPTLARPLQKYLRTTRQQLRYPLESILKHLAHCITFDLNSQAFLERYTIDQPCVSYVGHDKNQNWSLISDDSPSRQIREGTVFQLKREDISIVVAVSRMPIIKLSEEDYDPEMNKFVLRLNSETSV